MRWHARTEQLVGAEAYGRLQAFRVGVYGLGGVGSFAVEALARAGIGHLRVVDHDVVNPSNLNRQLFALRSSIGRPKAEVAAERIRDINPDCGVDARRAFINGDSVAELLAPELDIVVDAIDSVNAKVALMQAAFERNIPTVSSMGAGGRLDGSRILLGDLSETDVCPLAAIIRKRLRRRGITTGIRCVYSTEPCRNDLLPNPIDLDAHVGPGRKRTPLGTLSYMPALFGLRVAEEVIRMILAPRA
jgi:tRNA A37 threonylcarbamoyladenosine dehydratase